jgi:hypothetical protein
MDDLLLLLVVSRRDPRNRIFENIFVSRVSGHFVSPPKTCAPKNVALKILPASEHFTRGWRSEIYSEIKTSPKQYWVKSTVNITFNCIIICTGLQTLTYI